jgi:nitrous oxidase accessory protein NosD
MKKTASALTLILALLFSAVAGIGLVNMAGANPIIGMTPAPSLPSITIKSDGSIDPANVPINKTRNVYTLTDNIANYVLEIQCNNITVDGAGFTFLRDSVYAPSSGITINSSEVTVKNMKIYQHATGILVYGSHNTVTQNNLGSQIALRGNYNNIIKNTLHDSGIYLGGNYNNIVGNIMRGHGIFMSGSIIPYSTDLLPNFSTIVGNTIEDCGFTFYGVSLSTGKNIFYRNNFINNTTGNISPFRWQMTQQGWKGIYPNDTIFDNGSVGNYWSDYNGTDANGDGIGDTPYIIGGNLLDRYPLMAPFDISSAPLELPEWSDPQTEPFPTPLVAGAVASVAVVCVGLLVYFTKIRKNQASNASKGS